jgi:hypothetical protein
MQRAGVPPVAGRNRRVGGPRTPRYANTLLLKRS